MKKEVMLVTGAGQISMAIARRIGYGGATASCFYGSLKPEQ